MPFTGVQVCLTTPGRGRGQHMRPFPTVRLSDKLAVVRSNTQDQAMLNVNHHAEKAFR